MGERLAKFYQIKRAPTNRRLVEQSAAVRINPNGQQRRKRFPPHAKQPLGVLGHRDSVEVNDRVDQFRCIGFTVLEVYPLPQSASVISQVRYPGRLDAREYYSRKPAS